MNSALLTTVARRTMHNALRGSMRGSIRRITTMSRNKATLTGARPLYKGIYTPRLTRMGVRHTGHKVEKSKYSIVSREAHGFIDYMKGWEYLIFSEKRWWFATMWIWGPSVFATFIMFYVIWNSVMRDPEVRLRPHKKAWHFGDDGRTANGVPYKFGAFIWIPGNRTRINYLRKVAEEGFEHDEPGQIGWEESPIPKLDEQDESA